MGEARSQKDRYAVEDGEWIMTTEKPINYRNFASRAIKESEKPSTQDEQIHRISEEYKKRLAESEAKIKELEKNVEHVNWMNDNQCENIRSLEEKLAEKQEAIDKLNDENLRISLASESKDKEIKRISGIVQERTVSQMKQYHEMEQEIAKLKFENEALCKTAMQKVIIVDDRAKLIKAVTEKNKQACADRDRLHGTSGFHYYNGYHNACKDVLELLNRKVKP